MSIKSIVDAQCIEGIDYSRPQQAIKQANSLKSLSKDLYSDAKRFVYELLQNADDAAHSENKVSVAVKLFGDELVVAHTGKPFDERDIRGICGVDDGTKKEAASKTGFKGIGFKAVFGQSNHVTIFSNGEYFRFDESYIHEWRWDDDQATWEQNNDRKFVWPWQIIPIYTSSDDVSPSIVEFLGQDDWTVATIVKLPEQGHVQQAVRELAGKSVMFLFLKNIESLQFDLGTPQTLTFTGSEKVDLALNGHLESSWLKHTSVLNIPTDVTQALREEGHLNIPEKLIEASQTELTFAALIDEGGIQRVQKDDQLLYAYLPTEENNHGFPVLINAGFLTTSNRETLHQISAWNQWLFRCIAKELLTWIAALAQSPYRGQAYAILPAKSGNTDELASAYNQGFTEALKEVAFVLNTEDALLKVDEAIVDFTFLSDKRFVGAELVKGFCIEAGVTDHPKPFAANLGQGGKLRQIGCHCFEWKNLADFLNSAAFVANHTVENNQLLIAHLWTLCVREQAKDLDNIKVSAWPFILDHKDKLCTPKQLYTPSADDLHWNSPDSELSYIHPDLQTWLAGANDIRHWLEELGVQEKTDLSFLKKDIIPNAAEFITEENAIVTIHDIFNLHSKGELSNELALPLHQLCLLTQSGSLLPANQCYLANVYQPRVPLEATLNRDIFVSNKYLPQGANVTDWQRFFIRLGVKEGIELLSFEERRHKNVLISAGFIHAYFEAEDKKFQPFMSVFLGEEYSNFYSLFLLHETFNYEYSKLFWSDLVQNQLAENLSKETTVYWGQVGKAGQTRGDSVENFVQWYVKTQPCIPVSSKHCLPSTQVFLNSDTLRDLLGEYLPVFDGPELDQNWRAFFQFKTELSLQDFLTLLTEMTDDRNEVGKLKQGNWKRVSEIYASLLTACENWSEQDRQIVRDWATTTKLPDEDNLLVQASELKFYADGSNSIFQGAYQFIRWDNTHRQHPQSTSLLDLFGVETMYQSQFQISPTAQQPGKSLHNRLVDILPYWAKSRETEVQGRYEQMHYELSRSLEQLQVFEASELSIRYGEQFEKRVYAHLNDSELYVQKDWQKELVMLNLTDLLCRYFKAKGQERQLAFFLRAELYEIHDWFRNQDIELPPLNPEEASNSNNTSDGDNPQPKVEKTPIDYSAYWAKSKERNAKWMEGLEGSPADLLVAGLKRQSSYHQGYIYHFSHIENAVKILNENSLKSRSHAEFKDSASQGVISQTDEAKKQFARFYFRPHTPTQYYVENLGQGSKTIESLGEETVCPVPVFFKIPIEQVLNQIDQWQVSLGSMAVPSMKYGAEKEIIEHFDFDGLYQTREDLGFERYKVAAHQEFLVPKQLPLEGLDVELVVQNEWSMATLKTLLGSSDWKKKVKIDKELFLNKNSQLQIEIGEQHFSAMVPTGRKGQLILQVHDAPFWLCVSGFELTTFQSESTSTYISSHSVRMEAVDLTQHQFTLHLSYNGQVWQYYAQNIQRGLDDQFIRKALQKTLDTQLTDIGDYLSTLAVHPLINYWFEKSIGGPDRLNLKAHTLAVLANYIEYFNGKQSLFSKEAVFLLFLALHDIGKPRAVLLESKTKQHEYTISIIDELASYLPASEDEIEQIKNLLNGDPIGHYLNPVYCNTLEETMSVIEEMAVNLRVSPKELWPTLIIYYQCDAAGYHSLRERLFKQDTTGVLVMHDNTHRLRMQPEQEAKLIELEHHYAN